MASKENELAQSVNHFSIDIYKAATKDKPSENAFMSASSVLVVMAMVHMGAKGNTLEQMVSTLKFNKLQKKRPHEHLQEFLQVLNQGSADYTLRTANRLYPHADKTILDEYVKTVMAYFGADTKSLDFTAQPDAARVEINNWVEGETNGKIKDLLAPGTITPLTAMVVVNAIYFKGNWVEQFDASATRKEQFFLLDKSTIMVDMMSKKFEKVNFGHSKKLGAQLLELPYQGGQLSMVIVLPDQQDGLPALEEKLSATDLNELISGSLMYRDEVEVSLPKFKLEAKYVLNDMLASLGMPDLFDEAKADLSGMSSRPLHVSLVVQKAFVDVNEEGTEAAAATAVVMTLTSARWPENKFKADHPFMFMIVHKTQGVPLFMGRLTAPPSDQNVSQQRADL